ncbi:hypothetical protein RCF19_30045 [Rhodococcus qingshengii]
MTAPDPGLTDLIAAHTLRVVELNEAVRYPECNGCDWVGGLVKDHAAHLASVVEQHTNGRTAELEAAVEHWKVRSQYNYDCGMVLANEANIRAETAEATIARVRAVLPNYSAEPGGKATAEQIAWLDGTKHVQRQLRAALEGE